jgi:hypothetical protein
MDIWSVYYSIALSGRYVGKLFMTCGYDADQQLLPLAFAVVADEKSVTN